MYTDLISSPSFSMLPTKNKLLQGKQKNYFLEAINSIMSHAINLFFYFETSAIRHFKVKKEIINGSLFNTNYVWKV